MNRSLCSSSANSYGDELEEISSLCGKVCLILCMRSDYGIFIIDLAADTDEAEKILTVDDDKFVETRPNLRLCGGIDTSFCVIDATLYIFYIEYVRNSVAPPKVYSYELSSAVSQFSDVRLKKSMMQKVVGAEKLSSKVKPQTVRYCTLDGKSKILLFSTRVRFCDRNYSAKFCDRYYAPERTDFELYDPNGRISRILPPLRVCPTSRQYSCMSPLDLKLFHPRSSPRWEEFSGNGSYYDEFGIVSFGFEGCTFLIETDFFGRMFSLDLESPYAEWRLCENGIHFSSENLNILTPNGLCMNAYIAKEFKPQMNEVEMCVPFPVSNIDGSLMSGGGLDSSAITLLGDYARYTCTPIIVQLGFDCEYSISKIYWFLDVLRVDLRRYPIKVKEDDDTGSCAKFVNCIKSFKCCVKLDEYVDVFILDCGFVSLLS